MTSNQPQPSDLDRLAEQFPQWSFEPHWFTAATGSDRRSIVARRGAVTVSGWTAADVAEAIRTHERGQR